MIAGGISEWLSESLFGGFGRVDNRRVWSISSAFESIFLSVTIARERADEILFDWENKGV